MKMSDCAPPQVPEHAQSGAGRSSLHRFVRRMVNSRHAPLSACLAVLAAEMAWLVFGVVVLWKIWKACN